MSTRAQVDISTRSKVFGYFPARVSFPGRVVSLHQTLPGKETLAGVGHMYIVRNIRKLLAKYLHAFSGLVGKGGDQFRFGVEEVVRGSQDVPAPFACLLETAPNRLLRLGG